MEQRDNVDMSDDEHDVDASTNLNSSANSSHVNFILKRSQVTFPIRSVNSYLSCLICQGYFRDAHTVMDCLHTCWLLGVYVTFSL